MAEVPKHAKDLTLPEARKLPSQTQGTVIDESLHGKYGFSGDEVGTALREYVPDTAVEKKMLRKVDLFQIPMLWIMCVMAYVDRNNIVSWHYLKGPLTFC